MKFIPILPFEYDDKLNKINLEIIYLNIDQIRFISPIGETGNTIITLLNNDEILSIEPLYKIFNKLRNAK
jgi:hypothetical protein